MKPDLNPHPQWQLCDPPPLRNRCRNPPEEFIPLQVFGFAMSEEGVLAWGAANDISPDQPLYLRMQYAWNEINRRLPHARTKGIYWKETAAYCVVIGSNDTKQDLELAADIKLINKYDDVLRSNEPPGWFRTFA
ncbi:hypothetical protein BYT27DRAFT_7199168 [Phlegmacium glaucopus]|nr:hypothetical protein BYT27DRAFT_7199168 [Phlegmacium glaucopus]